MDFRIVIYDIPNSLWGNDREDGTMKVKCVVCKEMFESESRVHNVCSLCMDEWRATSKWYQKHVKGVKVDVPSL